MIRPASTLGIVLLMGAPAAAQPGEPLPDTYGGGARANTQAPDTPPRRDASDETAQERTSLRGTRQLPLGAVRSASVPEIHVVASGDTLWDISARYFGDPWHWPQIWSYNAQISNPHWIYPGDRIRLRHREGEGGAGEASALSRTPLQPADGIPERAFHPDTVYLRHQAYLDADALERAGVIVGAREDHMLLAPHDDVYVRLSADARPPEPGQRLTVFRRRKPEERVALDDGVLVRILGTIRVRDYDAEQRVARGVISEGLDPIERGDRVAPVQRRFDVVPPQRNAKNLGARIIAALEPKQLLAEHNIVFLDVGSEHGVRAGNRFFVVRRGDPWRQNIDTTAIRMGASRPLPADEKMQYPEEIIAEAQVLHVRPTTLTALITRSLEVVKVGDRAEMREGY